MCVCVGGWGGGGGEVRKVGRWGTDVDFFFKCLFIIFLVLILLFLPFSSIYLLTVGVNQNRC